MSAYATSGVKQNTFNKLCMPVNHRININISEYKAKAFRNMAVPIKSKKKLLHTNTYLLNKHHTQFIIALLSKHQASSFSYNRRFQSIPQAHTKPMSTEAANTYSLSKGHSHLLQEDRTTQQF